MYSVRKILDFEYNITQRFKHDLWDFLGIFVSFKYLKKTKKGKTQTKTITHRVFSVLIEYMCLR